MAARSATDRPTERGSISGQSCRLMLRGERFREIFAPRKGKTMIKVLIVDDELDAAVALKRNIDGREDIRVISVLTSGEEVVARCQDLMPDVILMDAKMPGMGGIEACRQIKEEYPAIKVLILTFYQVMENEVNAVQYGCDGYLYKGISSERLMTAIRNVQNDFSVFEKSVQKMIQDKVKSQQSSEDAVAGLRKLTDREIEIVSLITAGRTDKEIAQELKVDDGYIRNKLTIIREKLGLRNSKELAVFGAKAGL